MPTQYTHYLHVYTWPAFSLPISEIVGGDGCDLNARSDIIQLFTGAIGGGFVSGGPT